MAAVPKSRLSPIEELFDIHVRAAKLPEPTREFRFAPPRRWRADFAWPDQRVLAEIEGGIFSGGRHTRGIGFEADAIKYNTATLMGFKVFRFTGRMIRSGEALRVIEQALEAV
ncbi:hypothetical protein [Pararobbsia alpina]|uniref:DUF559 domain-containing protein n=1 Tax=Pararobbsia alpina TaxID=621374 RepID=A0A6S7B187_9BURK|nr:hypothetical protein [Pararobbsia alpina]CAB3784479.1 hypothetical protein LMG28138_01818 [Pararobbsia alpina]